MYALRDKYAIAGIGWTDFSKKSGRTVRSLASQACINAIADAATEGESVYVSTARFQPIAADDVVDVLAGVATSEPKNGIVDLAGPEAMSMAKFIQTFLSARNDGRKVIPDADAKYFGAVLDKDGLAPTAKCISGRTRFADWVTSH